MNYAETLRYLDRFVNYEQRPTVDYSAANYKLDRVYHLLELLGNPHQAYPTLLIAGSKGKGSTAAMLAAMLGAAGLHTGFYSKPHLHTFRERVRADGQLISEAAMADLFTRRIEPAVAQIEAEGDISMVPTYFELSAVLGFLYFAELGVDIAVIEVGMGGRLDATNVVTPLVSVITPISLEHTAVLGDTLAKIAFEKAGIIKPGGVALISQQPQEADEVFVRVAAERGARLVRAPEMAPVAPDSLLPLRDGDLPAGWQFAISLPEGAIAINLPLLGRHQVSNAQTAVCALLLAWATDHIDRPVSLAQISHASLYDAMRRGLAAVEWPGRLEIVSRVPLIVVDGAHNGESALRLHEALEEDFQVQGRKVVFVFGVNSDKDAAGIVNALAPLAAAAVLTPLHSARSSSPETIAPLWQAQNVPVVATDGAAAAMAAARELAQQHDAMICVTGSLYLVGEVRDLFGLSLGSDG